MKAKIQGIDKLFGDPVSYRIPQFQRPYAWSEKQWEPLWEDVRKIADSILKHGQEDLLPHFMGSIVLQPMKSADAEVSRVLVVDGQQRLTTLQLLLKATQKAFQESPINTGKFKNLDKLLLNDQERTGNDPYNKTKIRQTNRLDQDDFRKVIRDRIDPDRLPRAITNAYKYFHAQVHNWITTPTRDATIDARATALHDALVKQLKMVSIILDTREERHVIFEILNARGEPLKQADLIKSMIMYKANVDDDEQKARELWGRTFEADWWWEKDGKSKKSQIRIDRFLNYWIMMYLAKDVTLDSTAEEFRHHIEVFKPDIEKVAQDINEAGKVYRKIQEKKIPGIELFLERVIETMGLSVITPPLLWLYTNDVSEEERQGSARALESYLVRRMLCEEPARGLSNLSLGMVKRLKERKGQPVDNVVVQFLEGCVGSLSWPEDKEVISYLAENPIPGTKARKKMVLEAIATSKPMSAKPLGDTSEITVERILPPGGFAVNPNGNLDGFVDFIGNLTLASKRLNFAIPNKSWENKKKALHQHSGLYLNKELLDNAPEVWDKDAIVKRSEQLAQAIVQIWPHADGI